MSLVAHFLDDFVPIVHDFNDRVQAKLDIIIRYLEMLDLHYHALWADFTPPVWDMTVQKMIFRLRNDQTKGVENLLRAEHRSQS